MSRAFSKSLRLALLGAVITLQLAGPISAVPANAQVVSVRDTILANAPKGVPKLTQAFVRLAEQDPELVVQILAFASENPNYAAIICETLARAQVGLPQEKAERVAALMFEAPPGCQGVYATTLAEIQPEFTDTYAASAADIGTGYGGTFGSSTATGGGGGVISGAAPFP